jgi:hydrogenase-4 component E
MMLVEILEIAGALFAILMVGSGQLRLNLTLFAWQTMMLAAATAIQAKVLHHEELYIIAPLVAGIKGLLVPIFLTWILRKIGSTYFDQGIILAIPISMHVAVAFLPISYLLASSLSYHSWQPGTIGGVTAGTSLLFTGIIFMLTRRKAMSQIIGFLTLENGIYLFGMTQTKDMPLIVEMGVLLDVLVAVMIGGLIIFKIKQSFEHIDVTQLNVLKED